MAWYKDWFRDANYSFVYEHRDDGEAEQMIDLIERIIGHDTSRRVLDLACGSGRHAISFAKRGYQDVTGVDLSPALLTEAIEQSEKLLLKIRFLERDMREIPDETFGLVANLFTSFGYFEKDSENEDVIRDVARHLSLPSTSSKDGGWLVIDFFNSNWIRGHFVAHDERILRDGTTIDQTRWIQGGRIEKRLLIRMAHEAREYIESVRLFELSDFEKMFRNTGLSLENVFGNYSGDAFNIENSPRLIMFARLA
jgi:SAM-dependent methyltransferase